MRRIDTAVSLEPAVAEQVFPRVMEIVYGFDIGGSERLALQIARHLHDRGVPVSVCATHTGKGPISQELKAAGIGAFPINGSEIDWWTRRWRLFSLFRRQKVDVLHVHHVSMFALCYWPARLSGVSRLVLTEHTDYELKTHGKYRLLGKRYAPKAETVTVIHGRLKKFFVQDLGVAEHNTRLIPNGVDLSRFYPRESDNPLNEPIRIGWVGRFHPDKDLATLIRAFATVRQKTSLAVELVLIGVGPELDSVKGIIKRLDITDAVHLEGARTDVPDMMRTLDIFALSSRTEGVPLVILEAFASGLPVVATAVGGVPELLSDGGGILVAPGDVAGMAEGLLRLVSDPAERIRLSREGRAVAVSKYDSENTLSHYRELLVGGQTGK